MDSFASKLQCSGGRKIMKELARYSKHYATIKLHDEVTELLSELKVHMLKEECSQWFPDVFPSLQETGNNMQKLLSETELQLT